MLARSMRTTISAVRVGCANVRLAAADGRSELLACCLDAAWALRRRFLSVARVLLKCGFGAP
eukprot:7800147-Lingulodinium_polyedra.AAC.1